MIVKIIPCLQDNYSYLIIDESNNDACVIDPSEAKPVINFIENIKINLDSDLHTGNLNLDSDLLQHLKLLVLQSTSVLNLVNAGTSKK